MTGTVGLQKGGVFTGGAAKNAGVARTIEQETGDAPVRSDPGRSSMNDGD